ncbi:hypothetical protein [Accumulibacter sp.]|nr:hypothetical protein [Accumulibacter sp.]MCM8594839.1 hypothetical protein [Accumulibacter sp.]MCM8625661.1 hypothetical protein [Accumulibacter sp.]MDS4048985.1 hypothetical protein [Accumulibacter sp.]
MADGVSGHSQIVEEQADVSVEVAHGFGDAGFAVREVMEAADGEAAQA